MRRSQTGGFDRLPPIPNGTPTMTIQQRDRLFTRRWIHRLVPVSIVILIVGSLLAVLGRAVSQARNAAMSAATT